MRLPIESVLLKKKQPKDLLLFAATAPQQDASDRYFINFNNECLALAVGTGQHSELAAKLACESAIWAYKLVRLRNYYWEDKKLFLKRIFRSTGLTLWQKKKETGFTSGVYASLTVCITSGTHVWIGSYGTTSAVQIYTDVPKCQHYVPAEISLLGSVRYGVAPSIFAHSLKLRETVVLGETAYLLALSEKTLLSRFHEPITTAEELSKRLLEIIGKDQPNTILLALHRAPIKELMT